MSDALAQLDATELARRLADGETSSRAVVEACVARAESVAERYRPLAHLFRDEALAAADRADERRARGETLGPLDGLPFTVKENVDVAGVASTLGLVHRRDRAAARDAVLVTLARAQGAVLLGKGNVPQTLLSPMETVNELFGTTNNPWSLAHGPGGSSGGEAASLALGVAPLGIGTDIGGSIRVPASFCGVSGLKPTVHRWSNAGSATAIAGQETIRAQTGPMARTVADLCLLFRALDPLAMAALDPAVPPVPFRDPAHLDPATLRVGYYEDDGFLTPAASCRRAVREAADALRQAGVQVVPYRPPHAEEILYLYFATLSADGSATLERALGGERVIDPLKTLWRVARMPVAARKAASKALALTGERRVSELLSVLGRKGVERLWELTARRTALIHEEMGAWQADGLDAVLCPTFTTPAAPHGMSHDFTMGFTYAARYNVLNLPAGVVPVTRVREDETTGREARDRVERRAAQIEAASAGLPVGVQIAARPYREDVVLALLGALEARVRDEPSFPRTPVPVD